MRSTARRPERFARARVSAAPSRVSRLFAGGELPAVAPLEDALAAHVQCRVVGDAASARAGCLRIRRAVPRTGYRPSRGALPQHGSTVPLLPIRNSCEAASLEPDQRDTTRRVRSTHARGAARRRVALPELWLALRGCAALGAPVPTAARLARSSRDWSGCSRRGAARAPSRDVHWIDGARRGRRGDRTSCAGHAFSSATFAGTTRGWMRRPLRSPSADPLARRDPATRRAARRGRPIAELLDVIESGLADPSSSRRW